MPILDSNGRPIEPVPQRVRPSVADTRCRGCGADSSYRENAAGLGPFKEWVCRRCATPVPGNVGPKGGADA